MSKTDWTDARLSELQLLESVVRCAGSLNSSTNVADKILTLQKQCELLNKSDLRIPRESFLQFLNRLALTAEAQSCPSE